LKRIFEEESKAKEKQLKMLENQKKQLEIELQKINERESKFLFISILIIF